METRDVEPIPPADAEHPDAPSELVLELDLSASIGGDGFDVPIRRQIVLPGVLFLATCLSTFWAGTGIIEHSMIPSWERATALSSSGRRFQSPCGALGQGTGGKLWVDYLGHELQPVHQPWPAPAEQAAGVDGVYPASLDRRQRTPFS